MSPEVIFSISYILLCACIIYPPSEFISAGFTVEAIFSKYLGSEQESFTTYHIKKSCLNLFVYSLLPLAYVVSLCVVGYIEEITILFTGFSLYWKFFATTSLAIPFFSLYQIKKWCENNYEQHPIVINLKKFCNNNTSWKSVANDVDIEFRRFDKVCIHTSAVVTVIATENWILKVMPLTVFVIYQSDASLVVKEAKTYEISNHSSDGIQYLNIEIKSSRQNVNPFIIRINARDFKDLRDRVARSIEILPNVKFHKSVIEQFVDVFKETIKSNPIYDIGHQDLDMCLGCSQVRPNVKIQKLCEDTGVNNCTSCYCRPMWCSDCMAKWFASRQDADQQNKWLSSKCTCPMCRAIFCMLDVCRLGNIDDE
uniref:Transmembrane protein n=1 Tax=Anoplophora glabripennis TaxID=217634 RepID=V5I946_ANOGL